MPATSVVAPSFTTGAGVVFKGSGFWQTDYARSGEYKKSAEADAKPAESKSGESKSGSTPAPGKSETPKTESKPAAEKKPRKKAS